MKHEPLSTQCPGPGATLSRRQWLVQGGLGFGGLALASLLDRDGVALHGGEAPGPQAPRQPRFPAKEKSVIFLFMTGGPSQMETFDPKPALDRLHGQSLPASFGKVQTQRTSGAAPLLGTRRTFRRHGESGLEISDLFPHLATCADELAVIRSCHADSVTHAPAMYQMNTGRVLMGFPSLGSWAVYGLGSVSENLPAFVVMPDPDGALTGGPPCWGAGFLPPVYQGTPFRSGPTPILNLRSSVARSPARQRRALDLAERLNALRRDAADEELAARTASYELAFRMQSHAPEAVDIARESAATKELYGINDPVTEEFGSRCLRARRLVERGVRFVQLYHGGGPGNLTWDAHADIEENHLRMAPQADRPIAGLLRDLRSRGLLDETLVVWGGEFGRTPMSEGSGTGRDHSPFGFSMWMAGGGIRGGQAVGATDELGLRAVENPYHVNDIHATILHQLGLDHHELTYLHNGRNERLTDAGGRVIDEIV